MCMIPFEDDENIGEVYCDGCDRLMGVGHQAADELVLCHACTPECCTTEDLLATGDPQYWALIGHRQEVERMEQETYRRFTASHIAAVNDGLPF